MRLLADFEMQRHFLDDDVKVKVAPSRRVAGSRITSRPPNIGVHHKFITKSSIGIFGIGIILEA